MLSEATILGMAQTALARIELPQVALPQIALLSLQIGMLVLLVYVLSLLVRRGPAEVRYALWLTVVLRLCLPVSLVSPLGLVPFIDVEQRSEAATVEAPQAGQLELFQSLGNQGLERDLAPAPAGLAHAPSNLPLLILLWLSGAMLLSLHFFFKWWQARRLVASCEPNPRADLARRFEELKREMGLRPGVELRVGTSTAELQTPAVFGLWRPTVLLPRVVVQDWQLAEIEPVLIHELVHLRRHDLLINALQCVLQALYFFHPLVWLMNWKLREERELICDDEVVRHCGSRSSYVRAILRLAESQRAPARFVPAMGMASRPSSLGRRVARLLDRSYREGERRHSFAMAAFVLGLLCVGLVSSRQVEAEKAPELGWSHEAQTLFALAPDEDLRLVDPAVFSSRLELYRAVHPRQAAEVPEGPQRISFLWDEATGRFEMPRFSFGTTDLGQILYLLGIESHEIVGARQWLEKPIPGDLVLRRGTDLQTLLKALSVELAEHHGLSLDLRLGREMREVVVARGQYEADQGPITIGDLSVEEGSADAECPVLPVEGMGSGLRMLGRFLGQPVFDEIQTQPGSRVRWLFSPEGVRDPERLLAELMQSTSLRFDKEHRNLRVLRIEAPEMASPAAASPAAASPATTSLAIGARR